MSTSKAKARPGDPAPVEAYVDEFLSEMERVSREIDRSALARAVDLLFAAWKQGRTVFVMGNGGSASTATHLACDLAKYTIVGDKPRFRVMGLTDNVPLVSAWTNDGGFSSIFVEQLRPWIAKDDVVIGVSVHGGAGRGVAGPWSQNLIQAMALARERSARIIGLSGFDGGAMKEMADVCVVVPMAIEPLGTPVVETWHVAAHHLFCYALRRRIEADA